MAAHSKVTAMDPEIVMLMHMYTLMAKYLGKVLVKEAFSSNDKAMLKALCSNMGGTEPMEKLVEVLLGELAIEADIEDQEADQLAAMQEVAGKGKGKASAKSSIKTERAAPKTTTAKRPITIEDDEEEEEPPSKKPAPGKKATYAKKTVNAKKAPAGKPVATTKTFKSKETIDNSEDEVSDADVALNTVEADPVEEEETATVETSSPAGGRRPARKSLLS